MQGAGRGHAVETELHRPRRCRGDGQQQIVAALGLGADQQRSRAAEMGQRIAAEGETLLERAGGQMDAAQQFARLENILVVAGHEIERGNLARLPAPRP